MRDAARPFLIVIAVLSLTAIAEAQVYVGADAPRRGSIEASGGVMFAPGFDMGSMTAELTRSTPTDKFDLFTSDSEVSGFPGVFVRLGYYLSESFSLEGGMRYARPRLSVLLSGDAESAPDVTADETVSHYLFEGSVLWLLAKRDDEPAVANLRREAQARGIDPSRIVFARHRFAPRVAPSLTLLRAAPPGTQRPSDRRTDRARP